MKTIIYTIIALLALNAGLLIAGGIKHPAIDPETVKITVSANAYKLAPATPLFAEFNDGIDVKASPEIFIGKIAPVTPREADFDDESGATFINIEKISPVTPKETEFEELEIIPYIPVHDLSPSLPVVADFTE